MWIPARFCGLHPAAAHLQPLANTSMKRVVAHLARLMRTVATGWSYAQWDPPCPGDGI
jgi:hypothetical protein